MILDKSFNNIAFMITIYINIFITKSLSVKLSERICLKESLLVLEKLETSFSRLNFEQIATWLCYRYTFQKLQSQTDKKQFQAHL